MADCMDAVCQCRQTLVVFKRDVQLCIIGVFPVWAAILLFPVVGRCCSHFRTLSLNSWRSKTHTLTLEYWRYLSQFLRYKYFPVWAAILLFPVFGRWRNHQVHFLWTRHSGKLQNCRWNFDDIYHSSRDTSISGLGDHITISGCRSLLQNSKHWFHWLPCHGKPIYRHQNKHPTPIT